MTYELHRIIVKGKIAGYARTEAEIEGIKEQALAMILREIATELDGKYKLEP